ncbi:hypothetical protein [Actinocorallia lasiicapitis]
MAILPAVLALACLSACGGGGSDGDGIASVNSGAAPSASATPSLSLSPEDARLKFEQCLRDAGIKFKTSKGGGMQIGADSGDKNKVDAAMKKCQPLMAAGGLGPPDASDPAVRDKLVKFAQCMREHGVNMKDPGADGGLRIEGGSPDGDGKRKGDPADDPKMKAADAACRHLLPDRPGEDKPGDETGSEGGS